MTNRREFFQTTAAIAGSFILPASLFATPSSNFHFLHVDSYKDWPLTDPVQWFLQNAYEPILARAAEGVNGGEKPWRLAGSGGRLNCAAPKCSVVDFVIRWKAVIMAGFRVKDPEETSDAGVHQYGDLG